MLQTAINADLIQRAVLHQASIIFIIVYALIVFRNLKRVNRPVWVIMFAGAVSIIFLNGISLEAAYAAINIDVIFFLIGSWLA